MKALRFFWVLFFIFLSAKTSFGQIHFKLALDGDGVTYKVSILSDKTFVGINSLISTAQVTVVVPHGSGNSYFQTANLSSPISNMRWVLSGRLDTPTENPDKDYLFFSFINNSSPIVRFDMPAAQEILIFSFKKTNNCSGQIYLLDNQNDPLAPPNSEGINIGNSMTVLGAGGDAYKDNLNAPPTVNLQADKQNPCAGSSILFIATTTVASGVNYLFQWFVDNKSQGDPSTKSTFTYNSPKQENDFEATISVKLLIGGNNPCDNFSTLKSLKVAINGLPTANINYNGDNCTILPIKISANVLAAAQYQWLKDGKAIENATNEVLNVQQSGEYAVSVSKNGCTNTSEDIKIIGTTTADKISANAGKDTTIVDGEAIKLQGKSDNAAKFSWTPADQLDNANLQNPIARPTQTTTFTLTATSANGCPATASVLVSVMPRLYIPNSFSPNNDGEHDTWEITNIAQYPETVIQIYNRWGNLIFSSKGYSNPFDGTIDATKIEAGTYFYTIITNYKTYQGTLELLR